MKPLELPGLQVLRGLAAVMVLIGHVLAEAEHYMALPLPGDAIPWTRGVDIFFVISGFVVALSAQRYLGQPGAFLARRLMRVVPLYFLFTSLMVAALLLVPSGAKDTALDPAQIISSYTFFPYAREDGRIAPVLSLGWTLNYEVFFYGLLAVCLCLPRPFLAIALALIGLSAIGVLVKPSQAQLSFWTNPLIMEFLFGLALARLWQAGWHWPAPGVACLGVFLGLALLVALDPLPLPRFLAAGLPAAVIVAAGTMLCPLRPLPGMIWGASSYALYLSHRFTLRAATLLVLPFVPHTVTGGLMYTLVVCGVALMVGVLVHRWIETPMMRSISPSVPNKAWA